MNDQFKHIPVLLQPALQALNLQAGQTIADLTFGLGGHSQEIIQKIGPTGHLFGFELDPILYERAMKQFSQNNFTLINDNFSQVQKYLEPASLNGAIADLGVSSYHFSAPERGFSFQQEAPLDMRLNPETQTMTASDLVNNSTESDLIHIFSKYGQEKKSKQIAKKIKQYTKTKSLGTTRELAELVSEVNPKQRKLHPATKVFQALRITVNEELGNLARMLEQITDILAPGANLVVISFHSLEDRIVKNYFRQESRDCICDSKMPICTCDHRSRYRLLTRKPITPDEEEIKNNPKARSAKMRVAQKIN